MFRHPQMCHPQGARIKYKYTSHTRDLIIIHLLTETKFVKDCIYGHHKNFIRIIMISHIGQF